MNKLWLALLSICLGIAPAQAQQVTNPSSVAPAGAYNASPIIIPTGRFGYTQIDNLGNLKTILSAGGVAAQISLDGALSVNTQPQAQFADTFSAALDTTTNWTAKNSTGTAVVSAGQLVINSSTTASAWGGVASQQAFAPVGVSPQVWGVLASFTVIAQPNSVRVWGMFTVPGTPTTAVPVTDGYIYRLDGTGALFAEIWSAGVAVSSVNVTTSCLPAANIPAIFAINYRASLVQFSCGTSTVTNLSPVLGINPVNQVLNVSALSIAGSTPPAASAVLNLSAIALAALSPGTVKSPNQAPNINDPYLVVGLSPNAPLTIGNTVGATPTDRTITSASGASQQIMAANASRHSLTIVNNGNANCGVNPTGGTAAINGAGTLTLGPLGAYTPRVPTLSAVTVICTAAQPIYGDEN